MQVSAPPPSAGEGRSRAVAAPGLAARRRPSSAPASETSQSSRVPAPSAPARRLGLGAAGTRPPGARRDERFPGVGPCPVRGGLVELAWSGVRSAGRSPVRWGAGSTEGERDPPPRAANKAGAAAASSQCAARGARCGRGQVGSGRVFSPPRVPRQLGRSRLSVPEDSRSRGLGDRGGGWGAAALGRARGLPWGPARACLRSVSPSEVLAHISWLGRAQL